MPRSASAQRSRPSGLRPAGRMVLLAAAALACLLLAAPVAPAGEGAPAPEALAFVAGFSDQHLAEMLASGAGNSPQIASLAASDYDSVAQALDAEIGLAIARYGPGWQHNMALAWTPLMTGDEFTSLALAGAQSPHVEKYLSLRSSAGQSMQALSQQLYETALQDVVTGTLGRLAAPAPASQ